MRYTVPLSNQSSEYLERLARDIKAELAYRKALEGGVPIVRMTPRCSVCGHTGHNIMTCGDHGLPRKGEPCDCGRSDCPNPSEVEVTPCGECEECKNGFRCRDSYFGDVLVAEVVEQLRAASGGHIEFLLQDIEYFLGKLGEEVSSA